MPDVGIVILLNIFKFIFYNINTKRVFV